LVKEKKEKLLKDVINIKNKLLAMMIPPTNEELIQMQKDVQFVKLHMEQQSTQLTIVLQNQQKQQEQLTRLLIMVNGDIELSATGLRKNVDTLMGAYEIFKKNWFKLLGAVIAFTTLLGIAKIVISVADFVNKLK